MRSLFLKVFLWFWLAMILVVGALAGTYYLTHTEREPRPPQFIKGIMWAYSRNAVASFEHEGPAALNSFLDQVERGSGIRAHLFDASGTELAGRAVTPDEQEVASQAARTGSLVTRRVGSLIYEASPMRARDGSSYAFVAAFPFGSAGPSEPSGRAGPPRPPRRPGAFNFLLGDTPMALVLRVITVILTAGVLCYLLARYMVSPVVKLRAVTRQVAGGDLSARVGPLLGKRRDELADMGRDFDAMATQIELLMGSQQRLLRDISHELRSPLTRLGVALHQVRKRTGPEAAGHLARIEREAERLNEMIGQLLTLVRWESGAGGLQREPVDLAHLVREVAEDANYEARSRNRAVRVVRCDECRVVGTPSLLRSAVENVVRNAVRYTTEETTVEISLRYSADESCAVISVADKGAGVPEESIADIFRPFYRVEDARDRESGGTGLELAITARAVSLHGGTMTAFNASDGGFVVELRLPIALDHAGRQIKLST